MNTPDDGGSLSYGRRAARLYEPFVAAVTLGRYRPLLAREVVRLGLGPADRILDLCCGTGLLSRELARRLGPDGEVVGVDASEAMLEQARLAGGRVVYVRAEADSLPLPDGHFDGVTLFLGLHEIAQAARLPALREVRRILRPGGRGLVLDFASGGPALRRGAVRLALSALEGPEAWTITEPGFSVLLSQAGFRPERPRPVFLGILEAVGFARP
jgi:ubiquinone/menaquinone biosynthesis C-methylase UbiE